MDKKIPVVVSAGNMFEFFKAEKDSTLSDGIAYPAYARSVFAAGALKADGTWFAEGHGVDPDIQVEEDLTALAKGRDAQLERAIEEAMRLIKTEGYTAPKQPAPEVR